MRIVAIAVAAFAVSGPAAAQNWEEYTYPEYAFSVTFPAKPQVETTTYQVADGRSVPAHVYRVRWSNGIFTVTVAELANTGLDERTVIDHAVKTLSAGGKVIFDIPHRIYRVYGRQFAMQGTDGSRSTVSLAERMPRPVFWPIGSRRFGVVKSLSRTSPARVEISPWIRPRTPILMATRWCSQSAHRRSMASYSDRLVTIL